MYDLIATALVSLGLIPLVFWASGFLRSIPGLAFILLLPGYALISALFPKKDRPDTLERIALSFGLSIALVALNGYVFNYTSWGLEVEPILFSLTSSTILMSAVALYRRLRVRPEARFRADLKIINLAKLASVWRSNGAWNKILSLLLVLAIGTSIGSVVYVIQKPRMSEAFTEFYVLGPDGKAKDYPSEVAPDNQGKVILTIANHEGKRTSYRVEILEDGEKTGEIGPKQLDDGDKWEIETPIIYTQPGLKQKVEFRLFRGSEIEVYQSLYLLSDAEKEQP